MSVASPPGSTKTIDKAELLPVARQAAERLGQASTVDEVRDAFQDFYRLLGWKCLCRLFVLHQTPEEALRLNQ